MNASTPRRGGGVLGQVLPALFLAAAGCGGALLAQAPTESLGRASAFQGPAGPQPRSGPATNRNLIVVDPAHGGPETGGKFADQSVEKDVTLALASRLRGALAASGFSVVLTRDAELQTALTTDQRAELANRQHAAACVILHATPVGSGVHLFISGVQPTPAPLELDPDAKPAFEPVPWEMAQAGFAAQSLQLQNVLFASLSGAGLSPLRGRGPVRPLDNLLCPAVAVEVAPLGPSGNRTSVTDADYQQRLVDAIAGALGRWRDSIPVRQRTAPGPPAVTRPAAPAGGPE